MIISCADCNGQVSNDANACVHCGSVHFRGPNIQCVSCGTTTNSLRPCKQCGNETPSGVKCVICLQRLPAKEASYRTGKAFHSTCLTAYLNNYEHFCQACKGKFSLAALQGRDSCPSCGHPLYFDPGKYCEIPPNPNYCKVCCGTISPSEAIYRQHSAYHAECFRTVLQGTFNCPKCRYSLPLAKMDQNNVCPLCKNSFFVNGCEYCGLPLPSSGYVEWKESRDMAPSRADYANFQDVPVYAHRECHAARNKAGGGSTSSGCLGVFIMIVTAVGFLTVFILR